MMLTPRLKTVRKIEDSHRKFMCVQNDIAKSRQDLEKGLINKIQDDYRKQREKSMVRMRKVVVKKMILKRCMDSRKGEGMTKREKELFGEYGGKTVHSFIKEANGSFSPKTPKNKKAEKLRKLLEESRMDGKIMADDDMKQKVEDYLVRKWGMKVKQKVVDPTVLEHEQSKKPKPRNNDKLPPLFALYKVAMRPLGKTEKDKVDQHPNDFLEEHLFRIVEPSGERKREKKGIYRKLECTRPSCGGYMGNEVKGQGFVLPPINYRTMVVERQ